jgi:hypothetical protein
MNGACMPSWRGLGKLYLLLILERLKPTRELVKEKRNVE